MDEDDKEALQNIVDDLNKGVQRPPYNNNSGKGYSREYKQYKTEEEKEREINSYEKFCLKMGDILNLTADEGIHKKLAPSIRLLGWDITPGMVLSAAIGAGVGSFIGWVFLFGLNTLLGSPIPFSIMLILGIAPIGAGLYTFYKPTFAAKNKVIDSSGEMILSILYMVVYMRSSPNLEGALRFAALNLDGPISKDFKRVLWRVEVGEYSEVSEALHDYTKVWKEFNEDFLESLQLLEAAMSDPDDDRREDMLQDAIDSILDSTRERMKHYAQNLKTPVMILNALGAMLPVLGMIMLPLISVFMGGAISAVHLFLLFNVILPITLYWFMEHLLASRPPTTSTKPVSSDQLPPKGRYNLEMFGMERNIPSWPIGLAVFIGISFLGWIGYLAFPHVYPRVPESATIPGVFMRESGNPDPMLMVMRSTLITVGLGMGMGVSKLLGYKERKKAEDHLESIEKQFPRALFQLGNNIAGGTPIEVALEDAAEATKEMEISGLFEKSSRNIRDLGMTFEQSLFNSGHGALVKYPSQTINTVMRAILEASHKGTSMAAMAMLTISRYLENIHETQETLNDLLEDTTSTILMLAYLLAPVVSGIAVGMSQTIMTAIFKMSQQFNEANAALPQGQTAGAGGATQFGGILQGVDSGIPPELLQFVVGIYLIQLLYILGTFYMKITKGENDTYRQLFIGKLLIVGMLFYSIVLTVVGVLFGGVISSVAV
jgi:Flp pilus assembly protein TadB